MSTIAEEEEAQNESTSTCKETWGADVRDEFIIAWTPVIGPLMLPATQQYLFKDTTCKKGLLKSIIMEHNA